MICSSLLLSLRLIDIQNILLCVFTMEFPRVKNARNSKINRTELGCEYVNSTVRTSVEWGYGKIIRYFAFRFQQKSNGAFTASWKDVHSGSNFS